MTATYTPAPSMLPANSPAPAPVSPYGAMGVPSYAPQPQPQPQPQPMYIQQQPQRGGSNAVAGIAIVLLAVLAAVTGYFIAREAAPGAEELARYQQIAASEGFREGQYSGVSEGRNFAIQSQRRIAQYRAAIARQKQWNAGWRRGMNQGKRQPVRRSGYGYSGYRGYSSYRAPTYRGPSSNQRAISSALSSAQAIANATGAPVDVEIY